MADADVDGVREGADNRAVDGVDDEAKGREGSEDDDDNAKGWRLRAAAQRVTKRRTRRWATMVSVAQRGLRNVSEDDENRRGSRSVHG